MAWEVTQEHIDNVVDTFKAVGIDVEVMVYEHIEYGLCHYATGNEVFVELNEWKYFEVVDGKVLCWNGDEWREYEYLIGADFTGLTIEQCIKQLVECKLLEPCDELYVDSIKQQNFTFSANDIVDVYLGNSPFKMIG